MMGMTKFRIGMRLGIGFGLAAVLTLAVAALAWVEIGSIKQSMDSGIDQAWKLRTAQQVYLAVNKVYLNTSRILAQKEMEKKQEAKAVIEKQREIYKKGLEELRVNALTDTARQLLAKIDGAITVAREANNRALALSAAGKDAEGMAVYLQDSVVAEKKLDEAMEALLSWREKRLTDMDKAAADEINRVHWLLIAGTLVLILAKQGY